MEYLKNYTIEFHIGQIVFLKTDKEQKARLITGILLATSNSVTYRVAESTTESWHYGFEISDTIDILLSTTN